MCLGATDIKITKMYNSGQYAEDDTIQEFNDYCKKHEEKTFTHSICLVSIKRVYNHPDKENSYTQISYECQKKDEKI